MRNTVGKSLRNAPKVVEHKRRARGGPKNPERRGMSLSPTEAMDQLLTILTEASGTPRRTRLTARAARPRRGAKKG